jgi:hypothetical protein
MMVIGLDMYYDFFEKKYFALAMVIVLFLAAPVRVRLGP